MNPQECTDFLQFNHFNWSNCMHFRTKMIDYLNYYISIVIGYISLLLDIYFSKVTSCHSESCGMTMNFLCTVDLIHSALFEHKHFNRVNPLNESSHVKYPQWKDNVDVFIRILPYPISSRAYCIHFDVMYTFFNLFTSFSFKNFIHQLWQKHLHFYTLRMVVCP